MRPYEVMVIFDAELDEETIRSAVARSIESIKSRGAEPGQTDCWGKRRFAYELKHRWEGYYVVFQAKAEPAPAVAPRRLRVTPTGPSAPSRRPIPTSRPCWRRGWP